MRQLITYFVRYPVGGNLIAIAIVVLGAAGILSLNSSYLPLSTSKWITVNASYPGASPREVEEGVISKIEANLQGLYGISEFSSTSAEGSGSVDIEVAEGYDVEDVLTKVKNVVAQIPSYPSGLEPVSVYHRETWNEAIYFAVYGTANTSRIALKAATDKIENDLRLSGVISQIIVDGLPSQQIEISIKESHLRMYELTFNSLAQTIRNSNILSSGGLIKGDREYYQIRVKNKYYNAYDISNIIVKTTSEGSIVRLRDVATIKDTWEEDPSLFRFNGKSGANIQIDASNKQDLIGISDYVEKYIKTFNAEQTDIQAEVIWNGGARVSKLKKLLFNNVALGIFLVLIFLTIFLRPTLALWVALGLPIAFLGMFLVAPNAGLTINLFSLFGMIIVIGILVDDGIVIAENIYAHYEKGKSISQAAIDGTMEVLSPIISSILTTIVAFSTFFFLDGRLRAIFSEVSEVVIYTLLISLVEALILLPMHIAHSRSLQKKESQSKKLMLNVYAKNIIQKLRDRFYIPTLRFFLQNKFLGFTIPICALLLTIGAQKNGIIRTSFFPKRGSNRVTVTLNLPQGSNPKTAFPIVSRIEKASWELNEQLKSENEGRKIVQLILTYTGETRSRIRIHLDEDRTTTIGDFTNALEKAVGPVSGVESLTYGGNQHFGGSPIALSLSSLNSQELIAAKNALKKEMAKLPQLKNLEEQNALGRKELNIKLKDKGRLLGLSILEVIQQVRYAFFGYRVQRFQRGRDEVTVWLRYDRSERKSIQNLENMIVTTRSGSRIPFSEVASYEIQRGVSSIRHLDGQRVALLSADLRDDKEGASNVLDMIKKDVVPKVLSDYPSVSLKTRGQSERAQKTSSALQNSIPYILVLMYLIIAFAFRSYSQPFLLLSLIPFSFVGVAWGHWAHSMSLNMFSLLGIIALVGVVVNDGLVFIGKFNTYLKEGLNFNDALLEAGRSRFRAILLTSLTTVAGLAPIILEDSRDTKFLVPMAISICYGISMGTVLTLLMLPLMLSLANKIKFLFTWLISGKKVSKESLERAIKEQKNFIH